MTMTMMTTNNDDDAAADDGEFEEKLEKWTCRC